MKQVVIFNPETGTPVRLCEPGLAPDLMDDMTGQGRRVAPLAFEVYDRTWAVAWPESLLKARDYEGTHRRPMPTTRPHPTQPMIPGVR
jgi:hypothetical protein